MALSVSDTVLVQHVPTEFGLTIARDTVLVQLETQFLARRRGWDKVIGIQPSLHQFDLLTSASWLCPNGDSAFAAIVSADTIAACDRHLRSHRFAFDF